MNELLKSIIMWILSILGTVITTVVLPVFLNWLNTKIKNENLKYVASELGPTVTSSVDCIYQTFVKQLKEDNKFDADKQKEALSKATKLCYETLSNKAKKIISKDGIDLEQIIIKYVEASVLKSKDN